MLDILFNLASSKTASISRITGKSEKEIKTALEKGRQYLPQLKNANDGGVGLAKSLGIDRAFAEDIYKKYGHYADKVPLVGRAMLDREYNKIIEALDTPTGNRETRRTEAKSQGSFNKNKYKKL